MVRMVELIVERVRFVNLLMVLVIIQEGIDVILGVLMMELFQIHLMIIVGDVTVSTEVQIVEHVRIMLSHLIRLTIKKAEEVEQIGVIQ